MGITKDLIVCFFKLWRTPKTDYTSFDDFLDRLENLEKLYFLALGAGALNNQLQTLRSLNKFSMYIARNDSYSMAVYDAVKAIQENKIDPTYFYELVSRLSGSYVPMTKDLLVEFMNDLVKDLQDLLRYKVKLVEGQIRLLKEELMFLRNFLRFAADRCFELEAFKHFSAHVEGVALDAACLSYSCLTDKVNDEKLSHLLLKIKPIKPEVREMYIQVLRASKPSESSDEHVLEAFVLSLQNIMSVILSCEPSFKLPKHDQLEKFNDELRFLRILLMDPPRQYIEPENLNDLFRSIDTVSIESGALLFSLYVNEMKEETAKQVNLTLVDLLEKVKCIKIEAREISLKIPKPSKCVFPKTDGQGFIRFFLENLKELRSSRHDSIHFMEHHINTIQKDLEFLISLVGNMEELLHHHEELKSLWTRVLDLAYHAEYVIDSFVVEDGRLWYHLLWLDDVVQEIQVIKADVIQIHSKMSHNTRFSNTLKPSSSAMFLQEYTRTIKERIVGFEDEAEKIIELLINGPSNKLDAVSVVGMPGAGKTTLAKEVYSSFKVEKHFHTRGWCTVSQVYQKKYLLLSMLSHIIVLEDEMHKMDADDLAQLLYKSLKGRRYLVVLDDIWNIEAWQDLRVSFPDDQNGSRVLFTSRVLEVALQVKMHSYPHPLRPFNHHESWELLRQLVFSKECCPPELEDIGKQVAESCKGLPLSVVLIAGILAANKTNDLWEEVARSVSSRIIDDSQTHGMDIIGLSYKHLPNHLKPCFLYFGAFLEDQEVRAKRLIWLWSAEGFVRKVEGKSIEDIAEDYLDHLRSRNLITVSSRRADGGIKTCRVHDLLYQFCKAKSKEEHFWQFLRCENHSNCEQRRLCLYAEVLTRFTLSKPSGSHVRSLLLCSGSRLEYSLPSVEISFISINFKLLRVLDLECVKVDEFPVGLVLLVHLKYLALPVSNARSVPTTIANLRNLETLISGDALEFDNISKVKNLRHLHVSLLLKRRTMDSDSIDGLETISLLDISSWQEEELSRTCPNLRKLKCISWDAGSFCSNFLKFDLLHKLESLSLCYMVKEANPCQFRFPSTLTKLTLSYINLTQDNISAVGKLENLQVLKLKLIQRTMRRWDMTDGEFPKLRHLELRGVNLEEWNAYDSDYFPCLERLQLRFCHKLKEIPSCLGSVGTLEMIEVRNCERLDLELVRQIEQEQVDFGNDEFKLLIWDFE